MSCLFGEELFVDHAIVSVYAVDSETGQIWIEKNSDLSMMPSSCLKIVTTAAALSILGAESRFETLLEYDGALDASTLQGHLYIRGGGDPCLGRSWEKQITAWADAVQQLGIKRIAGAVVGDASKWEKACAVPSWCWEDLGNYYGAGACALSFHENAYSIFFKPGSRVGEQTTLLRTDPPLPLNTFQNEVKTGPEGSGDGACIYGSEFSSLQFLRGTIPAAVSEFSIRGAISDPAAYCADLLAQELGKRGIIVERQPLEKGQRTAFHKMFSPTVGEIVHWTNQKSVNLYAEHLLKKMGEVVYGEGSTAAGLKAVAHYWKEQNIDLEGFHGVDGSGLSRKNLITAKQLVDILLKVKQSPHFSVFLGSLPEYHGFVRAKQGSMSLARGYAGYAGPLVFAVLVNHCPNGPLLREKLDRFLLSLQKKGRKRM
jgi:D-alanyl-D-alanine carboxypeptidase/D-alanyl-D-alanine-endopeptidase (penicillin-binding protein 4)